MNAERGRKRRERKPPKPLDRERLEELALTYVARYATSAAKAEAYLRRKLRERGWSEEEGAPPDPAGIIARQVELGYIDDEAYARTRSGGLLRRGYGQRRVDQSLYAAGIDEHVREDVKAGEAEQRRAVLALARRRRLGPFCAKEIDQKLRDKQIAAILRAGHGFDAARAVMDAPSETALEEWVAEAAEQEDDE
ncbi:MAG: RecX family transcriptional regulator [Alteripontixanthobacter sp.]